MKKYIALLIAGTIWSPLAMACKCVEGDAHFYAKEMSTIFLADVTFVDATKAQLVPWESESVRGIPLTLGNIDVIKGTVPLDAKFFEVGYEFACQPQLKVGVRRVFVLWKHDQRGISLCNVPGLTVEMIHAIRRALRVEK